MKNMWKHERECWTHLGTGTIIRKNYNPYGVRNWWVEGGGEVGEKSGDEGCCGGFFRLSVAKKTVEKYYQGY